ncbi:hypothetical protein P5673_011664 [Acropora cervicornis]|uniref:Uncharacterized protein n=1 Tax=Acropora cervicornis TaxID=6130 RepID=A0AAD9QPJ4_ACRCE|nr:hypothetical protein P5673_011664 [Acropora cervicornis]
MAFDNSLEASEIGRIWLASGCPLGPYTAIVLTANGSRTIVFTSLAMALSIHPQSSTNLHRYVYVEPDGPEVWPRPPLFHQTYKQILNQNQAVLENRRQATSLTLVKLPATSSY